MAQSSSTTGFNSELFRPATTAGTSVLNLERPAVLEHLEFGGGAFVHLANESVQVVEPGSSQSERTLVGNRLKADIGVGLGLFDRLEAGLHLPVVAYQSGSSLPDAGQAKSFAIADPRLSLKGQLLRPENFEGFGLGVLGGLSIPSGATASFNSDKKVHGQTQLAFSWTPDGTYRVVSNLGMAFRERRTIRGFTNGDAFLFGLGGIVPVVQDLPVSMLNELEVIGSFHGKSFVEGEVEHGGTPLELLMGVRSTLPEGVQVQLGGGPGMTKSVGSPDFRLFLSAHWTRAFGDRDNDGISDPDDECPDRPGIPALDGCPEKDRDDDGIVDRNDGCPEKPEDIDGFEDEDGCPDPDNDGDGVVDGIDECPETAGLKAKAGCPEKDADSDGIPDRNDDCPKDPEDKDGFEDEDGCPDRDNDGDGIVDQDDECPDKPETVNGVDDSDGCPDEKKSSAKVVGEKIKIMEKVYFPFDRASVKARSYSILSDVARILKTYEGIERMVVGGHTDNRGDKAYNRKLSQRRAEAVRELLINRGVEPSRVEARGYGESKPIAPNSSTSGREKNRRVEFEVVEWREGDSEEGPSRLDIGSD